MPPQNGQNSTAPRFLTFPYFFRKRLQIGTFDYTQLGFQFLDFQLKSFVDPKPVELGESAIYQKFCLNKLV